MATSIAEQIAVKVRNRLLTIDEDDGFETTVSSVERPKRINDFELQNYQIILKQGSITPVKELSYPAATPVTAWAMPFVIAGIISDSDRSTSAIDTLRNQFWGDVVAAICTPVASWYNWDNLAVTSEMGTVQNYDGGEGEASGFQIGLTIIFRTDENDPFTAR